MTLARLRRIYNNDGPFATVYLEGRAPGEDAGQHMRLRWKALRERLASDGATDGALQALDEALARELPGEEHANGRVLVSSEAGLLLDEPWDAALGAGDAAHWTVLPELSAMVREEARSIRELVVIADQEGAQVRRDVVAEQHETRELDAETVEGSATSGVHKPRGGALAHNRIQRHADENLVRNAKDIASHVAEVAAKFRPRVLVLAGTTPARAALREQLHSDLIAITIETDRGGRDENASDEALTEELLRIAQEESTRSAEQTAEELESGLAHERAVTGYEAVAHAAEMGAVATLLLEDQVPASRESFLLKACTDIDASVKLVSYGTGLADGVGALLRFPMNS